MRCFCKIDPLSYIEEKDYRNGEAGISLLADMREEDVTSDEEAPRQRVHTSVTMEEISSGHIDTAIEQGIKVSPDSPYKNRVTPIDTFSSASLTFERRMTMYITSVAVLYEIDATVSSFSSSGKSEEESHKQNASFRFRLYMERDKVLMCFDRFESVFDHAGAPDISIIYGKWIDFLSSEQAAESIEPFISELKELTDNNFDVLSFLGDTIYERREDGFSRSGNIYRMEDKLFADFCDELLAKQGVPNYFVMPFEGGFEADFYDKQSPRLTLNIENAAQNYYQETERYTGVKSFVNAISCNYAECDEFVFKYIDNTVIRAPEKKDTITLEEFAKLFMEE